MEWRKQVSGNKSLEMESLEFRRWRKKKGKMSEKSESDLRFVLFDFYGNQN